MQFPPRLSISVQKLHSRIRLRILSCSRMSENASRTRSPRGKSPSGRMSRWPCMDHLKGTCNNSFCVKKGTLQNACSTSPRMDADFGKSALMRIARLMNNLSKGLKRMMTKVQVAILKKHEVYDRTGKPVVCRDSRHEHQVVSFTT